MLLTGTCCVRECVITLNQFFTATTLSRCAVGQTTKDCYILALVDCISEDCIPLRMREYNAASCSLGDFFYCKFEPSIVQNIRVDEIEKSCVVILHPTLMDISSLSCDKCVTCKKFVFHISEPKNFLIISCQQAPMLDRTDRKTRLLLDYLRSSQQLLDTTSVPLASNIRSLQLKKAVPSVSARQCKTADKHNSLHDARETRTGDDTLSAQMINDNEVECSRNSKRLPRKKLYHQSNATLSSDDERVTEQIRCANTGLCNDKTYIPETPVIKRSSSDIRTILGRRVCNNTSPSTSRSKDTDEHSHVEDILQTIMCMKAEAKQEVNRRKAEISKKKPEANKRKPEKRKAEPSDKCKPELNRRKNERIDDLSYSIVRGPHANGCDDVTLMDKDAITTLHSMRRCLDAGSRANFNVMGIVLAHGEHSMCVCDMSLPRVTLCFHRPTGATCQLAPIPCGSVVRVRHVKCFSTRPSTYMVVNAHAVTAYTQEEQGEESERPLARGCEHAPSGLRHNEATCLHALRLWWRAFTRKQQLLDQFITAQDFRSTSDHALIQCRTDDVSFDSSYFAL